MSYLVATERRQPALENQWKSLARTLVRITGPLTPVRTTGPLTPVRITGPLTPGRTNRIFNKLVNTLVSKDVIEL